MSDSPYVTYAKADWPEVTESLGFILNQNYRIKPYFDVVRN